MFKKNYRRHKYCSLNASLFIIYEGTKANIGFCETLQTVTRKFIVAVAQQYVRPVIVAGTST